MTAEHWWRDALDGIPLRDDGDRVFFVEPPADAFTDTQQNAPRRHWSRMRHAHYEWLAGELGALPGGRQAVDIGCGQSQFHDLLEPHFPCGIDFLPYAGARIVSDLNGRLPLVNESCDVAVLSNVLEHIYEPRILLAETGRILKNGGHMLIVVPFLIKIHQPPYDFFRYTNFALERLCREAGFSDVRVVPLGNLFDTHDLERQVRARILRRECTGIRLFAMRAMLLAERKCDRLIQKLARPGVRNAPDRDGFPHSFAVHAIKMS